MKLSELPSTKTDRGEILTRAIVEAATRDKALLIMDVGLYVDVTPAKLLKAVRESAGTSAYALCDVHWCTRTGKTLSVVIRKDVTYEA